MASEDGKCLLSSVCNGMGKTLQIFKGRGIAKLIERSIDRNEDTITEELQGIISSQGSQASVELHKSCYCSYTSKDHVKTGKKRKDVSSPSDSAAPPVNRVRRSEVERFEFKQNCLLCGEICLPLDTKHPDRWDTVRQCETQDRPNMQTFKDVLLDVAEQRNDEWGRMVAMRINSVIDLPAADAQYHSRCYRDFKYIPMNTDLSTSVIDDDALKLLIDDMYANQKLITWTTIELHEKYCSFGGLLTRKQMVTNLLTHLGDDVVVLHLEGCASIIGFRALVSKTLKLVKVDSVDEDSLDTVVRKITTEARAVPFCSKNYDLGEFTYEKTVQQTSATLLKLISNLVSGGQVTKRSLSLSQSIQGHITNTRNQTNLGLGIKLHHKFGSRELIQVLSEHGYIASYEEVLRFRKSSAKYVGDNVALLHRVMGLSHTVGIVFGWFDNMDLLIATPNGRRETHAMAHEFQKHPAGIIQAGSAQPGVSSLVIPRLNRFQAKSVGTNRALQLQHYTGSKKVNPPALPTCSISGISYNDACARQASLDVSQDKDVQWLNSLSLDTSMEWGGFNNQLARNQTVAKSPTTYLFGPLIDTPPSHPDTVLTSLLYMQRSLSDLGMRYTHLSVDMQLFAVAQNIKWNEPYRFQNVIIRPGGMHILMSFLGCIGKLMKSSGLEVLVGAAYGGLTGIMNGKSWVRSMRAFRSVTASLLRNFLTTGPKTFDQIVDYLEKARLHPTGRHWVDNLIIPTLIAHQFLRAEREGDWHLQQLALERMRNYFFVAGHVQYARHITQHLLEMRHLPDDAKEDLIAGAFVCRHQDGHWNAVSGDQFGEQTAIRIGKGGLKGMTLSPELVTEWIDAFPITVYVSDCMQHLYSVNPVDESVQAPHKEEGKKRRELDADDRRRIDDELQKHSHPLEVQSNVLYHITNGLVAPQEVNVADSVMIGEKMATKFLNSLPTGFHNPISSPIKTMEHLKRGIKVGVKTIFDLETIFLRLLMMGQQRQLQLAPIFTYELCAVSPSLIDEFGCLRKGKKSVLVNRLGVKQVAPQDPDIVIVDAQQLLYHVVWPCGGNASVLADSMKCRLSHFSEGTEKILVFDHYDDISAKDHERMRRAGEGSLEYNLTPTSQLPSRDAILKNKVNKRRLSCVLGTFNLGEDITIDTREAGVFRHDESDVTMVSYMIQAAEARKDVIRVLSDDTDVFILLVYWVYRAQLNCHVQMELWDGTVLYINATCTRLGSRCLQLLGMHALTGCDTVSYPFGKGKVSALNTLEAGDFPGLSDHLGEETATYAQLVEAGLVFFRALYGQPPGTTLNTARYNLYSKKKGKPLKIMALPPTDINLALHVRRAHLQLLLWKAADQQGPPASTVDIEQFGWKLKDGIPSPAIGQGPPAPPALIDVISCSCKTQGKACSTEACSCHKQNISCTIYCFCSAEDSCFNPYTGTYEDEIGEEQDEEGSDDEREGNIDVDNNTARDREE